MNCRLSLSVFILLVGVKLVFSQSKSQINALGNAIPKVMDALSIPGLSVAVSQKGKILYSKGFGFSNVKNQVKVNEHTLFRMASVSKLFASSAVAKLMDQGELDINEPIEKYLPEYPNAGKGVTTKLLLSHQAGIRHYGKGDLFNDMKNFKTTDEALKIFISDPLEYEPGTSYKYSTYAFTLIQAIVEAVSGMDYLDFLEKEIFMPLEMDRSFPDKKKIEHKNHSRLYRVNKKNVAKLSVYDNPSYKWGGGGMLSNVVDLVKFGEAHLSVDFFQKSTLDSIFRPFVEMPGTLTATEVGLAWRISKDPAGRKVYHHAGNMNGARSFLMICPEDNTVVAVMSNNRQMDFIDHFAFSIKDALLGLEGMEDNVSFDLISNDTGEKEGSIRLHNNHPYYTTQLEIKSIFPESKEVSLIAMQGEKGMVLRNLEIENDLLYLNMELGGEKGIHFYHRGEEGKWEKKEYIIR